MKKLLILLLLVSNLAFARDIKIIVPYAVGGSTDRLTRLAAKFLSNNEYNFVVDYKLGAGGAIAASYVAKTDETILMAASNGFVGVPVFNGVQDYKINDFVFLDYLGTEPLVVVVRNDGQIKNFKDFQNKAKTETMPFGHVGPGSSGYISASNIAQNNPNFLGVPYKGAPNIISDVLAGTLKWCVESNLTVGELIKDKKLLPIAVYANKRLSQYPDVPTVRELGINDQSIYRWHILLANKDADKKVVEYVRSSLASPEFRATIAAIGIDPKHPSNISIFLEDETNKMRKLAQ